MNQNTLNILLGFLLGLLIGPLLFSALFHENENVPIPVLEIPFGNHD